MRLLVAAAALALAGAAAPPRVIAVYPSGSVVPENLLRISLDFDRAPDPEARSRIGLLGADQAAGQSPFLSPALRSPDGRTVTLLLDPARVKTGTVANERLGRALRDGHTVTLTYDGQDIHRWRVGPASTTGLAPGGWRIAMPVPRAGGTAPVLMALGRPLDALDAEFVALADVAGRRVVGRAQLTQGETVWAFTPAAPWQPGRYQVRVNPELEDACGNRPASPFETGAPGPGAGEPPAFTIR